MIDISKLENGLETRLLIDEDVNIPDSYLSEGDLLALKEVHASGYLERNSADIYMLNLTISGIMVLPCAITNEPVDYPFKTNIDDALDNILLEIDQKMNNPLDILPIIWENILLEIPIRVVSKEARNKELKGNGWELVEDSKTTDNPLAKIKDILE